MIRIPPIVAIPSEIKYVFRTPSFSNRVPEKMYAHISLIFEARPVKYIYSNIVVRYVSNM